MIIRPNLKDKFPKYRIVAKWTQLHKSGEYREDNGTSLYQMFKRHKDEKQQ